MTSLSQKAGLQVNSILGRTRYQMNELQILIVAFIATSSLDLAATSFPKMLFALFLVDQMICFPEDFRRTAQ